MVGPHLNLEQRLVPERFLTLLLIPCICPYKFHVLAWLQGQHAAASFRIVAKTKFEGDELARIVGGNVAANPPRLRLLPALLPLRGQRFVQERPQLSSSNQVRIVHGDSPDHRSVGHQISAAVGHTADRQGPMFAPRNDIDETEASCIFTESAELDFRVPVFISGFSEGDPSDSSCGQSLQYESREDAGLEPGTTEADPTEIHADCL